MMSHLCRRAVELGAVSGVFSPDDMGRALSLDDAPSAHRAALWREMSALVTEVLIPDYGWQLKPDARLRILSQLISGGQVQRLIADAPQARPDDLFATFLRGLLVGEDVAVETGTYARNRESDVLTEMRRAGVLLDAVQFALQSPASDTEALETIANNVKRHIAELRQRRDLLIVLPRRHFGYETERRTLSLFLRSVEDSGDDRPIFLSGIGGVGKSALHARLFRHWQQRSDGPLTLTLDLDRRQLNAGSPVELFKEILRQCAVGVFEKGFPPKIAKEVGEGLKALRYSLADIHDNATFDRQMSEIASTYMAAFEQNWAAPLRYQPIAIAFDSFEALDRRDGSSVEIVLRLEEALRLALPRVRSLFAGREEPLAPDHMESRFGPPERRMRLRGIAPAAGVQLIAEEDARLAGLNKKANSRRAGADGAQLLAEYDHERIANVLKGHPLAMLMLVQFAHARPDEIERLLGELGQENGQFETEFAQVFLYERILDRISNPAVRALAHPGLVLRQLNTDLIREVLAVQSVGTAPVTEDQAQRLKIALEREYWLVEPDGQGFDLRHRPDLRRLMLPGLFAKPRPDDSDAERAKKEALTASALDVCAQAVRYFRQGPASGSARDRWHALPDRLKEAHGFYYASFVTPTEPEDVTVDQARNIDAELGEDVETMPLAWRGLVKALLDHDVSLDEQDTLDQELFEQVESSIFTSETKIGRGVGIKRKDFNLGEASGASRGKGRASAARMERQIADAFARADFDRVADLATSYIRVLGDDDGAADKRFSNLALQDVTLTPLWKVLLVAASQDHGLPDLDIEGVINSGASFTNLVVAISLIGKSGTEWADVAPKVAGFTGDPQTAYSYRQHILYDQDLSSLYPARRKAGFGALALMAAPIPKSVSFDTDHPPSRKFVERHRSVLGIRLLTARDVHSLYDDIELSRFVIAETLFRNAHDKPTSKLLRGLSAELYDPLVWALRTADRDTLAKLGDLITAEAPRWPIDLSWSHRQIDEAAPILVEMADRFGVLRILAQCLAVRQPEIVQVVKMYDTITNWFFRKLSTQLLDPLPDSVAVRFLAKDQ